MPTTPPTPLTNPQLLAELLRLHFDAEALCAAHGFTAERFAEFWEDPQVARVIAAWRQCLELRALVVTRDHQQAAAAEIRKYLATNPAPIESRRAATTLARIAHQMLSPPSLRHRREAPIGSAEGGPGSPKEPIAPAIGSPFLKEATGPAVDSRASARRASAIRALAGAAPPSFANSA